MMGKIEIAKKKDGFMVELQSKTGKIMANARDEDELIKVVVYLTQYWISENRVVEDFRSLLDG